MKKWSPLRCPNVEKKNGGVNKKDSGWICDKLRQRELGHDGLQFSSWVTRQLLRKGSIVENKRKQTLVHNRV